MDDRPHDPSTLRQASLFGTERPKIIPFESIAPAPRHGELRRPGRVAPRVGARQPEQPVRRPAARRRPTGQQNLDLRPSAPAAPHAIPDDAPIARPSVRAKAAGLDALVFSASLGLSYVGFHAMGGHLAMSAQALPYYGGAVVAMLLFYHLFWSILGRETAGMRWCGLRVLTFDGEVPGWRQRVGRLALAGLSLVAAGLGLLWALVDEEGLTWHDHITRTFTAIHDRHPSTFHRR